MSNTPEFLRTLLTAPVDSQEYEAAATRLEQHPELQPELEKLAMGDDQWWHDARAVLTSDDLPVRSDQSNSSVTIELEAELQDAQPIEYQQVRLDFLEPPTHPELLGRLGRYDIERVIGVGGMGIVLRAFDSDLHRVVAIKVLAAHVAHIPSARRRFAREAQAAAAVVHPHVIPIFNVHTDSQIPYLVMQYVSGMSLQQRVDQSGPLPVSDVLRIAQQTAAGLAAAHAQGLVHRDVKPANILLLEQVDRVLLSDFGLARAVDDASLTRTGILAGTPYYMSPEQAKGDAIDHRSDLFSLGSVIYFALTGHTPFRAQGAMAALHRICHSPHRPIVEVNPDVPRELSQLVDRLLAKDPLHRLPSAALAEQQLGDLLSSLQRGGLSLTPPSAVTWLKQRQFWAWDPYARPGATAIWLAVLLLAVGLGWSIFSAGPWNTTYTSEAQQEHQQQTSPVTPSTAAEPRQQQAPREMPNDLGITPSQSRNDWQRYQQQDIRFEQQVQQLQAEIWRAANDLSPPPVASFEFDQQVQGIQNQINQLRQLQ